MLNGPILTSAKTGSTRTTIKGTLSSDHDQTFTVEFFSNPKGTDEGKKFIGEMTLTTSADGLVHFLPRHEG